VTSAWVKSRHAIHNLLALIERLGFRKFPRTVKNFRAWPIEPHHVIPAFRDRQTVRNFAVAAAELDRH
jgi:hypothetical protein